MFSFLTATHFFIATALASMMGANGWQCLFAGVIASMPDVPAFVQVGLDIIKRRTMFARQSRVMLVAKELAHSNLLWLGILIVVGIVHSEGFLFFGSIAFIMIDTMTFSGITQKRLGSWVALFLTVILAIGVTAKLVAHQYDLALAGTALFLMYHWIIDLLTHSWNISDNKKVLKITKEEADVSLGWPFGAWLDLGLYDYRPADNGFIWKLIPKKKLEIAVLLAAIGITILKWV